MVREKAIAICAAEFEVLCGLPFLQRSLYLVLRWYMDAATGIVGLRRGISRQSLLEELYVEPIPGRRAADSGSPTIQALRSALVGLERSGLIVSRGNGDVLVFSMPKAPRIFARSKEQQPGNNRGEQPEQQPGQCEKWQGFEHMQQPEQQPGVNVEQQPTSRVKVNPLFTPGVGGSVRARETAADPQGDTSLMRVGLICRELRQQGIEAAPHLFANPDWQGLLIRFSNEQILAAAAVAKARLPENARIHLNYLKPILTDPPAAAGKPSRADQRAAFFDQLGVGNGTRRQHARVVDAEAHRVD